MNYAKLAQVTAAVLCVGIMVFFFLLEHDRYFKSFIEKNLKIIFLENFACTLEGTVKSVSILGCSLELHDVVTISTEKDLWQWRAKKFQLSFSWLDFFITRNINLTVQLEGMYAQSRLQDTDIGIVHHLLRLMGGAPGFPIGLRELQVKKGAFLLQDFERAIEYTTHFVIYASMYRRALKLDLKTTQGCVKHHEKTMCKDWACTLGASVKNVSEPAVHLNVHGSITLPDLGIVHGCSYAINWHESYGSLHLKNNDESLYIGADSLTLLDKTAVQGDIKVQLPLAFGQKFYCDTSLVQGHANLTIAGTCSQHSQLDGLLTISDITCAGISLGDLTATFGSDLHRWFGDFFYTRGNQTILEGSWFFDRAEREGRMECSNPERLTIPSTSYTLAQDAVHLEVDFTPNEGTLLATVHAFDEDNKIIEASAQVHARDLVVTLSGTINEHSLTGSMDFEKQQCMLKVLDAQQACVFSSEVSYNDTVRCNGFFSHALLQPCIESFVGYKVSGEGTFLFTGTLQNNLVKLSLATAACNIRIPTIYNLVHGITSTLSLDLQKKKLVFDDTKVQLDRGSLETNHATFILDDAYGLSFAYVPCRILKTLLTFEKDIFALLSGNFIVAYKKNTIPSLKGALIIDRGFVKKNIFSFATQKQGFLSFKSSSKSSSQEPFDCILDMHIETKDSIPIKTSFLDASARMNVAIKGSVQNPLVSGDMSVERGSLAFPYKPLAITKGRIYFVPNQLFDPYFELVAKGMIRKYHVVMRCDGSLQNPRISFESSPPLTEEQIITLLLAGSEEGSLSVVMPSVLMQGIQNILFGPEQTSSRLERYFKEILGPFKHIRFVPKFFDPQGRGGFRGAIEVDVNDQLHGIIQRNFSLPEDIKLEVEYFFADDSALRVIRDERGDFGGEVEMRWKF